MLSDWTPTPLSPLFPLRTPQANLQLQQHLGENVVRTIAMDGKLLPCRRSSSSPSTPCRATVFVSLTAKGTHTGRPGIFLPCPAFAEQNVQYILNVS